jgi:hypothetical protein
MSDKAKAERRRLREADREIDPDFPGTERLLYSVYCLICGRELQVEDSRAPVTYSGGQICNQMVYDGVCCVAYGNYGSGAFDRLAMGIVPPMGFVLCDECFKMSKHQMHPVVEKDN